MSGREQAVIYGLGAMLRSIHYESGGDEEEDEDEDDDDIDEEEGDEAAEEGQRNNDAGGMEEDNEVMANLPPDAILQGAIEADRAEADALFISCTAIRALDVVERIEQAIGKPVVTANQAMIWQSLRLSGCQTTVDGYGELLRLKD